MTLIRRDGVVVGPTLLKAPETTWTSPQGSVVLRAHEDEVHKKGTIQILKRSSDIQQVEVVPQSKIEDTQKVQNGIA